MVLTEATLYEFVRGPLASISFVVFVLGVVYQVVKFFQLTEPVQPGALFSVPSKKKREQQGPPPEIRQRAKMQGNVWGMNPGMTVITSVFHVCLFIAPLFLLAHNLLIEESWGIRPPSFPEAFTDVVTVIIMGFGLFFLYRRIFLPRVRAITSLYDYFIFFVVFAPFVTGFVAYHQLFAYKPMLIAHILTGELMLVCIPFTKLVHMIYFFLNRFFIGSEYSFGRGSRAWR